MPIDANRLAETIVAAKRMLRAQLPTYAETFAEVETHIRWDLRTGSVRAATRRA
ncbi:MAG: hypothetical protein ACJ74G_09920 [Blastocatellia bacterium]